MKPEVDNTFCWYPFTLLALKEWHKDLGIVNASPCCNSIRPETPDPLNIKPKLKSSPDSIMPYDIFHGEEMESIRQAMREGQRHPSCETCWKIEDRGSTSSYRLLSQPSGRKRDIEQEQSLIDNPELRSIDFAFGENCNLRCRMCQPGLSNKLRADYKFFIENRMDTQGLAQYDWRKNWHIDTSDDPEQAVQHMLNNDVWLRKETETEVLNWRDDSAQWQNILDNIHTLNHIKATGGETLLTKPFQQFVDHAIAQGVAGNIMLEFHTNATKFTDTWIEKFSQFDGLFLNLSIDSIGKNYEYCRYPMLWDKVDASLRRLLDRLEPLRTPKNLPIIRNFSFNPVISVLNAHSLPALFDYQTELVKNYTCFEHTVFWVDLLWPDDKYINVRFLPPPVKQNLLNMYAQIPIKSIDSGRGQITPQVEVVCDHISSHLDYEPTEQDRLNMLREITLFDKSRNQSYNDYLHQEIVEFLETPRA